MEKVKFEVQKGGGLRFSITPCTKRKPKNYYYVGSRLCCSCSYCYDIDKVNQIVSCRKKVK